MVDGREEPTLSSYRKSKGFQKKEPYKGKNNKEHNVQSRHKKVPEKKKNSMGHITLPLRLSHGRTHKYSNCSSTILYGYRTFDYLK